jgi:arylsulfatase A-like enzyme
VRSAAFVHYSQLQNPGSIHGGLFHSVDWLPTLARLAGAETTKNLPLDGIDIWDAIQTGGTTSPRKEIPVEIAACGPNTTQSIVDGALGTRRAGT